MFTYNLHTNYVTQTFRSPKRTTYVDVSNVTKKSNLSENLNKGFKQNSEISKSSIKKIISAVSWLEVFATEKIYITKSGKRMRHKLSFITLTLPAKQKHSDKEIVKKVLQRWLNNVRKNYGLRNYVYRAETQKNGNIHFHLVTDSNLNYYQILHTWNKALENLNYISSFKKNTNKEVPNSVDIKRVSNSSKISNYIAKYLAKGSKENEKRRKVDCRHYAMSQELSKIKDFQKNAKELAEFAYHSAKLLPNVVEKSTDWANYVVIDVKRLMAVFRDFNKELIAQFKMYTGFQESRIFLNANYSQNQNQVTFIV